MTLISLCLDAVKLQADVCLRQCKLHMLTHNRMRANTGHATLTGCTIYRNDMAIECLRDARIDISNCDISFNRRALELDGSGTVT